MLSCGVVLLFYLFVDFLWELLSAVDGKVDENRILAIARQEMNLYVERKL